MNRDQFEGKWHQLKGLIRQKWGRLTNDDVEEINGDFEMLMGKLQEKYGYAKEHAEMEFNHWQETWSNGEAKMNREQFQGKWRQLRGRIQQKWDRLTNEDIEEINGDLAMLMDKLRERYGYAKEKAEQEFQRWQKGEQGGWGEEGGGKKRKAG